MIPCLLLLPAALLLDILFGDPPNRRHPVCLIGWCARRLEPEARRLWGGTPQVLQRQRRELHIADGNGPGYGHGHIIIPVEHPVQQVQHAFHVILRDEMVQQHHHGKAHMPRIRMLQIRLNEIPDHFRMPFAELQPGAEHITHSPVIHAWNKTPHPLQALLRLHPRQSGQHSVQHHLFRIRLFRRVLQQFPPVSPRLFPRQAPQQGDPHPQKADRAGNQGSGKFPELRFCQCLHLLPESASSLNHGRHPIKGGNQGQGRKRNGNRQAIIVA